MNDHREPSSFRDPSGFLFWKDGSLYRQVNRIYQENYQLLVDTGLYRELVDNNLLIPHEEVEITPPEPNIAYQVIKPQPVPFISYPYEWCFGQLKDAALATLKIQELALAKDMSLKDASAYNIQFIHNKPILIDSLSFEEYQEGQPWIAYRQFCQHFLAPLVLMSHKDIRLSQLLRNYIDGIPLDLASKLLPFKTRFNFSLLTHIHLHASAQKRYAGKEITSTENRGQMTKTALMGILSSLESAVRSLNWEPEGTSWSDYEQIMNYSQESFEHKKELVSAFLEIANPNSVWDLGANTGEFSRLASQQDISTLSFDFDPGAVELNYQQCKEDGEGYLSPLLLDLTNPSPDLGWFNRERQSFLRRGQADAVMALALIHHLAISNNLPLQEIASFLARLGPWLIIEFVPKEDSQVQKLLAAREDIFTEYKEDSFEESFSEYYQILKKEIIQGTKRTIYLMKKR
jgi:ribosomal protein L11 methylase PrmA